MQTSKLPEIQSDGSYHLWPGEIPRPDGVKTDQTPRIVPFPVKSLAKRGAVLIFPGGGYGSLAPHEADPVAQWLNCEGIAAFVVYYRVMPHRHPAPLQDAQKAIRFVRYHATEWNVDPSRIAVLGFSAGGHLAATAATHFDAGDSHASDPIDRVSSRPDAAVLCYPVITFGSSRHSGSMDALIGADAPEESMRLLSNELQVTPSTPPTFLWHTATDDVVPVENSLLFSSALSRNHVPFELHVFPHGGHGLGLAQEDPVIGTWPTLCGRWLRTMGY